MKSRRNKAIAGWDRIDVGFRELLQNVRHRLFWNKIIQNLAHPDKPAITRTANDQNVVDLETRLGISGSLLRRNAFRASSRGA
jgi:hypothetical protein